MAVEDKVRENRLRRVATRRGFSLVKSRRRDRQAIDYGGYMVVDTYTNAVVLGVTYHAYAATLDDVEAFLDQQPSQYGTGYSPRGQ
jgi:ActR/RegA family two-component response regulator